MQIYFTYIVKSYPQCPWSHCFYLYRYTMHVSLYVQPTYIWCKILCHGKWGFFTLLHSQENKNSLTSPLSWCAHQVTEVLQRLLQPFLNNVRSKDILNADVSTNQPTPRFFQRWGFDLQGTYIENYTIHRSLCCRNCCCFHHTAQPGIIFTHLSLTEA